MRIYLPDDERDSPVVVCSELSPDSRGGHSLSQAVRTRVYRALP
jgi:hypothetical protein